MRRLLTLLPAAWLVVACTTAGGPASPQPTESAAPAASAAPTPAATSGSATAVPGSPAVASPSVGSVAPGSPPASAGASGQASAVPSGAGSDRTVTLADDRTTITLAVGGQFLLALGADNDWQVVVENPAVVDRVRNVTVVRGAQGVYEAKAPGTTTLNAVGDPPCRKSTPPCMVPSRLFAITIVVR